MKVDNCLLIKESSLKGFAEKADRRLKSVSWKFKAGAFSENKTPEKSQSGYLDSFSHLSADPEEKVFSVVEIAKALGESKDLLPDRINHTLNVVRKGLTIGFEMMMQYAIASGLAELDALNKDKNRGLISEAQRVELSDKWTTAAYVGQFSAASYIVYELSKYDSDAVGSVRIDFRGIPEISTISIDHAVDCMMFYYAAYLGTAGVVKTDLDFVKMTVLYFEAMINDIKMRAGSLKYTEPFTGQTYKLEGSEFSLKGFDFQPGLRIESMEFNRVEFDDIVGNRDAKHKARRAVERTLCFDFTARKNPFRELGGLPSRRLGYGPPGTGKSMLIAAIATLFKDRCEQVGIPFLFWPFPDTPVSEFQGKSAQKIVEWFKPLTEPTKVVYAPIDDAENCLEERTRQGVSEGVRGVIGVFLRYTEGAYAPNFGNSVVDILTNIPDQVDKAVLSRVVDRFLIAGAETKEDVLDQNKIWYRKYDEVIPGFVNMKDPDAYEYFGTQGALKSLGDVYSSVTEPKDETLREIFRKTRSSHLPSELGFFGAWYESVKRTFPKFTSRDIRNIQENVSARIMDFDLPEIWFEQPDLFFRKDYDSKLAMIKDLMKSNMKGLSFADAWLQESVIYLDNMVRMENQEEERAVESYVEEMIRREKAEKRFRERTIS